LAFDVLHPLVITPERVTHSFKDDLERYILAVLQAWQQ
jgi:hypothetical protein